MSEIIGDVGIYEEMGRMSYEEVFDAPVDASVYRDSMTVDEIMNNLHEDNAYHVFLDDVYRDCYPMPEDFESLVDNSQ